MRIPFIPVLLGVILCLIPSGITHAAQPDHTLMQALAGNAKLHRGARVLKDFYAGQSTTRVVVRLGSPSGYMGPDRLRERPYRAQVRTLMRDHTARIANALDTAQVRVVARFRYQPGFAAQVSLSGLNQLTSLSDVVAIEKDEVLLPHDVQGLSVMNGATLRGVYNGQGVAIAICDTGIDYTHAMLGGGSFPNTKIIGGYDIGDNDADPMDQHGHGTQCAGIAAGSWGSVDDYNGGVAYGAKLYAVKITSGSSGSSYLSAMIAAWEWCISHQYDTTSYPILVISTSFGGTAYTAACDSISPSMTEAAANAVAAGMTLFASSGNNGYCNAVAFPACISSVNSVGAVLDGDIGSGVGWCVNAASCATSKQSNSGCSTGYAAFLSTTLADMVPPYSNTADFLTMLAPSNNAYTTALGGGYSSSFGGTSAACPYAAGAAACIQSAAKAATGAFLTPAAVKSKLLAAGDSVTYAAAGIATPRVNLWKIDGEGDGMPDGWEIQYLSDITHTDAEDYDEDGLTNLQEYTYGTNPTLFDTDSDGYGDGAEVTAGTDPLAAGSHPNAAPAMSLPTMLVSMGMIAVCARKLGKPRAKKGPRSKGSA